MAWQLHLACAGCHYSTPGYVVYYLMRSEPRLMLRLQNGRFDAPGEQHSAGKIHTFLLQASDPLHCQTCCYASGCSHQVKLPGVIAEGRGLLPQIDASYRWRTPGSRPPPCPQM